MFAGTHRKPLQHSLQNELLWTHASLPFQRILGEIQSGKHPANDIPGAASTAPKNQTNGLMHPQTTRLTKLGHGDMVWNSNRIVGFPCCLSKCCMIDVTKDYALQTVDCPDCAQIEKTWKKHIGLAACIKHVINIKQPSY